MNKSLNFKMGQTHMQRYMKPLMEKIEEGKINPSLIITHRHDLEEAPVAYENFRDKKDGCVKVIMTP